jgi:hypothetical protein
LLHHLREYDIITDSELAYYIGEFNIKNIDSEMRSKLDLRRMKNVNDVRHVGGMGGGVDLGDVGCFYNPVQSMINMKTECGGARGVQGDQGGREGDRFKGMGVGVGGAGGGYNDSLSGLAKKQDLMLAIQRIKKAKVLDQEQSFKLANAEKIAAIGLQFEENERLIQQKGEHEGYDDQSPTSSMRISSDGKATRRTGPTNRISSTSPKSSTRSRVTTGKPADTKKPSSRGIASKSPARPPTKSTSKDKKPAPPKKAPSKPSTSKDKKPASPRKAPAKSTSKDKKPPPAKKAPAKKVPVKKK